MKNNCDVSSKQAKCRGISDCSFFERHSPRYAGVCVFEKLGCCTSLVAIREAIAEYDQNMCNMMCGNDTWPPIEIPTEISRVAKSFKVKKRNSE
jgi:hypothetical protein